MDLYQGTLSGTPASGILSHFGSMTAAIHRLDSMYALKQYAQSFAYISPAAITRKYNMQGLNEFASHMDRAVIAQYDVTVKNPLHLNDCWDDDPIGSGALDIFKDNTQLTSQNYKELEKIFYPFKQTIYPEHVNMLYSASDLQQIKAKRSKDLIFKDELQKRKRRIESLDQPWPYSEPQEIVWTDLTLKLREWALKNEYDAFVYKNNLEGNNEDCYVTLNAASVKRKRDFKFNKKLFLKTVGPIFENFVAENKSQRASKLDIYWAKQEQTQFWMPK